MLPRAELIIVTTPATGAQKVATRAVRMARKSYMRVAGVIENMSLFINEDGKEYALFGTGGDEGKPAALGEGPAADAFRAIATLIFEAVAPPIVMDGCSARLVALAEAALDASDEAASA